MLNNDGRGFRMARPLSHNLVQGLNRRCQLPFAFRIALTDGNSDVNLVLCVI